MIIANPIYDVVFKRLMEDKRVACFFIETLIGETILDIELKPQEFTFYKELTQASKQDAVEAIKERMYGLLGLAVYRVDFIATIKTSENEYKKVLIEIQKAKNAVDLMRFRNYLAEQYKKEDEINTENGKISAVLPIITIYLLGFKLNEIEASAIKVNRQYLDLITNRIISQKNDFIEKLTHDSYIVQIQRIQPKIKTKLERLLTIFEQNNFVDEREITKDYGYLIDDEVMAKIIEILHHAGTDPEERKEIEKEQEAFRVFENGMKELREALEVKEKQIAEKNFELSEKDKELNEKDVELNEINKELCEKDKELSEKDKELNEKNRIIEELMRKLEKST
jgi:hypothetical protein